jgi:antitoxin CptB
MHVPSNDAARRKRLSFRAWHRGRKEMDLLLGRYADRRLQSLSEADLARFERIIDYPDPQLYLWISGHEAIPVEADCPLLQDIVASCMAPPKP